MSRLRLIHRARTTFNDHECRVYRDSEWGEYVVRWYEQGTHRAAADYHTDDKQDAIATADISIAEYEQQA